MNFFIFSYHCKAGAGVAMAQDAKLIKKSEMPYTIVLCTFQQV